MSGTVRGMSPAGTPGTGPGCRAVLPLFPIAQRIDAVGAHDGEEGMGEAGEGDVAMPAGPATHLVLGQADLLLSL